MGVLFSRRDESPFPEPIVPPYPLAYGGTSVDNAMQLDAVWACVSLLSETVGMMPVLAYDVKAGKDAPMPAKNQPSLLTSPTVRLSMQEWLAQMMCSLLLRGNAYAEWTPGGGGQLVPLNPDKVRVTVEDGKVIYRVGGEIRSNIFHMTGKVMPGDVVGLSPISYASQMLQTAMSIDAFARGYFQDAPHPASVLQSDQPINQDQARQIKDRVMAAGQSREPMVLGLGLKMETLSVTPEESQFLATQQFNVERICRIFGVPPQMVGGGSSGQNITYANITQRRLDFLTFSVQGWLTRFENALSPLLPGRQHVRFDTSALIRMTPMDQAIVADKYVKTGVVTINKVRADMGLETVPWGDEPYLPGMSSAAAGATVSSEGES